MNGIMVLLFFLFITLLPALPLCFWFRYRHFGALPLLLALAAGFFSVLIASLAHSFFAPLSGESQMRALIFGVLRISLVEELSRLLSLFVLLRFFSIARIPAIPKKTINNEPVQQAVFMGAPSGLAAGFGFAIAENIFYSISNPELVLWRVFAVALHAACGTRIGAALSMGRKQIPSAVVLVLTAILTHAMYNFCILNPRLPDLIAAMLALTSLASALLTIEPPPHNSK